ncbi:MAG: XRE family transcriptional regulator [Clostridiales bacterium]|nr:XRE family transcriptional regulator [Clostridiales bacterium]
MSKKATKAADNIYCIARYDATKTNDSFSSREKASELLHIERTRLSNIELGNIKPYPDEVLTMAKAYNCPELCNSYCACECPIGATSVKKVEIEDFDRLALKVLGSLKDIDQLRSSLIEISEDGVITKDEKVEFDTILDTLDKISTNAKALQLWAQKNIHCE